MNYWNRRNKEKKQKDIPIEKNEAKRTEEPTSLEIVRNGSFAVVRLLSSSFILSLLWISVLLFWGGVILLAKEKGFLDALYQPHTVTGLLITFTAMIYFGFLQEVLLQMIREGVLVFRLVFSSQMQEMITLYKNQTKYTQGHLFIMN